MEEFMVCLRNIKLYFIQLGLHNEQAFWIALVGILSVFIRILRFKIKNNRLIFIELVSAIIICSLVIPYLRDIFALGDTSCYLLTYFLCQSGTSYLDTIQEAFVNKYKN